MAARSFVEKGVTFLGRDTSSVLFVGGACYHDSERASTISRDLGVCLDMPAILTK